MNEWDFYLLQNSAIKLLLLQEGKEFWVYELLMDRGSNSENRQRFQNLLKQTQHFFRILSNELWDFLLCFVNNYSTLTKAQNLFLSSNIFNNVLLDVTVVIVFALLVPKALNDRNPYFIETVAANLMKSQTVLKDILGRTGSCVIARTRRKQCDLLITFHTFLFFARNRMNSCDQQSYEFVRPAVV
jgi:hypothetical protein